MQPTRASVWRRPPEPKVTVGGRQANARCVVAANCQMLEDCRTRSGLLRQHIAVSITRGPLAAASTAVKIRDALRFRGRSHVNCTHPLSPCVIGSIQRRLEHAPADRRTGRVYENLLPCSAHRRIRILSVARQNQNAGPPCPAAPGQTERPSGFLIADDQSRLDLPSRIIV